MKVDGSLIRLVLADDDEPSFVAGSQVEGNYQGMGTWYPGVIMRVHADGTYSVRYDDGDAEKSVSLHNLRPLR